MGGGNSMVNRATMLKSASRKDARLSFVKSTCQGRLHGTSTEQLTVSAMHAQGSAQPPFPPTHVHGEVNCTRVHSGRACYAHVPDPSYRRRFPVEVMGRLVARRRRRPGQPRWCAVLRDRAAGRADAAMRLQRPETPPPGSRQQAGARQLACSP
eukprot:134875-Chlamydomonas_euryale.AAC.3